MRLIDAVLQRPPDGPVWCADGRDVLAGQVAASIRKTAWDFCKNRSAAIECHDNRNLALALLALDGVVERLLLLPGHLSEEDAVAFARLAQCDVIFTDDRETTADSLFQPLPIKWSAFEAYDAVFEDHSEAPDRNRLTRWIIPTSGTTGTPKLVSHTLQTLTRTVKGDSTLGRELRWGLLFDLTRFAGLQVFLQALRGGSTLVIPHDTSDLAATIDELIEARCNALSATPSMWRKLLMSGPLEKLPLRIISLGGEICDQGILTALRKRFPSARITHIYASTEAGVGFSVTDGLAGFPAAYLQSPPPGIELRLSNEGALSVRPALVQQEYLGRDESISGSDGWIDTGDLVEIQGERCIFLGRANGAINVGGRKVQPHEIETVILGVEGVAFVGVSGRKNPILGNLVEAHVVPLPGTDTDQLKRAIKDACLTQLEDFKRPAVIRFTDQINLTAAGKVART